MLANNNSNQTAYSIPLHKDMPKDLHSDMHGRLMTVIWHFDHLALTRSKIPVTNDVQNSQGGVPRVESCFRPQVCL